MPNKKAELHREDDNRLVVTRADDSVVVYAFSDGGWNRIVVTTPEGEEVTVWSKLTSLGTLWHCSNGSDLLEHRDSGRREARGANVKPINAVCYWQKLRAEAGRKVAPLANRSETAKLDAMMSDTPAVNPAKAFAQKYRGGRLGR